MTIEIEQIEVLIEQTTKALEQTLEYLRLQELKELREEALKVKDFMEFENYKQDLLSKGYEVRTGHKVEVGNGWPLNKWGDYNYLIVRKHATRIHKVILGDTRLIKFRGSNSLYPFDTAVLGYGNTEEEAWRCSRFYIGRSNG